MKKVYMPLTGVEGVVLATGVIDDAGQYRADAPSEIIPAKNVTWAGERSTKAVYSGIIGLPTQYQGHI